MEKVIKKYKLTDTGKQERDDIKYWSLSSSSEKTEATYLLWEDCCYTKGVNVNAQRLRRIFKITKLSQS